MIEKAKLITPQKPTKIQKIWFYLTCWRPITKYELSKAIVQLMKASNTAISNFNAINEVASCHNKLVKEIKISQNQAKKFLAHQNKIPKDTEDPAFH